MKQEIFQSYLSSFPAGFDFDFGILATLNLINFLFKFAKKKKEKKRKEKKGFCGIFFPWLFISQLCRINFK